MINSITTHWMLALFALAVGVYIGRKTSFLSGIPVIG